MVAMASERSRVPAERSDGGFYFHMAVVCGVVAVLGFLPTYWMPLLAGKLKTPPITHVHAVVFYAWSILFIIQAWLGASRRIPSHRTMGLAIISAATTMTILGILIAINRMHVAKAMGQLDAGLAFAIVPVGAIAFFAVFFAAAIANLRRLEWHKRLMLVAGISVLDAPIARWFIVLLAPPGPAGPPPVAVDIGPSLVALLILVFAMIVDWRRHGRIHPAYLIGAGAYVVWKIVQVPLSATAGWHAVAAWLMWLGS